MIKAVIFDMDGVILDSEPIHYEVEKKIMNDNGHDFQFEDHARYIGQTTRDLWDDLCTKHDLSEGAEKLAALDCHNYLNELKFGDIEPILGVKELIQSLYEQGYKLIVASSAVRENIEVVLGKFDLNTYFQGYVSGQDVKKTKPNPDIFLKAADKIGESPQNCLVIEDAKHGVAAAKSAGISCVAFRNLNSGNQDLSNADYIVNSIEEINIELIKKY